MEKFLIQGLATSLLILLTACNLTPTTATMEVRSEDNASGIFTVNLNQDPDAFAALHAKFTGNNPQFDIEWRSETQSITAEQSPRLLFVQEGGGTAVISNDETSKIAVGDIVVLRPDLAVETDSLISYLSFTVPEVPQDDIPTFIRPDWDDQITDTPGGCATETGAYRRILLTWLGEVGPYLYHSLNAHRVRIMDSFTHYHPVEGGFDEFYLVQMAMPGAKLITSPYLDQIQDFHSISAEKASDLLTETPLQVGDLIYIPRGVIHRGVGGVLAQVITIPGFKPGAEIGVDYHLRKINQHFKLDGADSLPYHYAAADSIVIK